MRRSILSVLITCLTAAPLVAQPVEFDPADFGKIVVAKRQSAGTGLVLEQAFGDYQNEPVISYGEKSIARRLGRPVGRLDVLYGNGKTGYCTAFIVDDQHLVTNNHCIPGIGDVGVQAAQFVAGYVDAAHPDKAEKFQVALEPLETSAPLDYSVLRVFGDPSARYGTVKLADEDPENSEFLWIIGHPQGQAQHISREGCAAADPPVSTEGKVVHSCDTLGGNSGSPVFRISDRQVVALHHAGDNRTGFNFAIPMKRILAKSQILKASAPQPTIVETKGACELLWSAAAQHGCLGYQTFLKQCGDSPLAPLARGLADQACKPVGPDPALTARRDEALTTVEGLRAEIVKERRAAERALNSLQGNLDRALSRAKEATSSVEPGSARVAELWAGIGLRIEILLTQANGRVQSGISLTQDMDQVINSMRTAKAVAELDANLKRGTSLAGTSRESLAYVTARKASADKLFAETEATVVVLKRDAVKDQAETAGERALKRKIQEAQITAKEVLAAIKTSGTRVDGLQDRLDALVEEAKANAATARSRGGAVNGQIAVLWTELADSLLTQRQDIQTHAVTLARLPSAIGALESALKASRTEADINGALSLIERRRKQAIDRFVQAAKSMSEARDLFDATETRVAALQTKNETSFDSPPVVRRCLEVSMPMFAVEGIAGVSREDFDANSAELACSAARKISNDPAVHYGYARALITKKRYGEALPILRNPRMTNFMPARYSLGVAYNSGLGMAKNFDAALALYRETAAAGLPQGKFSLGVYYSLGRAVQTDHARAGALLVESIEDGYAHPITQLHKLSGSTTRAIQLELVNRGYLNRGDVDGAFGPTTRRALERLAAAAPR